MQQQRALEDGIIVGHVFVCMSMMMYSQADFILRSMVARNIIIVNYCVHVCLRKRLNFRLLANTCTPNHLLNVSHTATRNAKVEEDERIRAQKEAAARQQHEQVQLCSQLKRSCRCECLHTMRARYSLRCVVFVL